MTEREYDVIVYGAGPEGVAAALAAAERSGSVLLADGGTDVGGVAVCGLMNCWRGEGGGPLMEHVRSLTRRAWGRLIFEPEELAQAFRKLLKDAGVHLLLGAPAIRVKNKRRRIKSVSFAGSEGRAKLSAWCYIDASPDFTLARLAGCAFEEEPERAAIVLQARVGGIDTRVPGVFDGETMNQYMSQFMSELATEELPVGLAFPALTPCLRGGTAMLNAAGEGVPVEEGPLGRTAAELRCRDDALAAIGFLQRNVPGYENCCLIHFAGQPLVRSCPQPARLRAESAEAFDESGLAEDVTVMIYRDPDNPNAEIAVPLGNLMSPDTENLLLARAGSMEEDRMPLLLSCGDAAGRAAAESLLYDGDVLKLDAERLRKALAK